MKKKPGHPNQTETGQVMTVDQVASYLQLNRLTVYRYVREGRIPAAKIGKLYRILRADVDEFLEGQKVGGPVPVRRRSGKAASSPPPQAPPAPRPRRTERTEKEAYVDPQRFERIQERIKERERAEQARYPLEWVMRGLH